MADLNHLMMSSFGMKEDKAYTKLHSILSNDESSLLFLHYVISIVFY